MKNLQRIMSNNEELTRLKYFLIIFNEIKKKILLCLRINLKHSNFIFKSFE